MSWSKLYERSMISYGTVYEDTLYLMCSYTSAADKPTYAQIAEWRKILHRLSYFLRSVDYLLLELLRRLVVTATRHLLKFVKQSYNAGLEIDEEVCATYSAVFVYTYMTVYVACI